MALIVTTSESCHIENAKNYVVTKRMILLVNTWCVLSVQGITELPHIHYMKIMTIFMVLINQ